MRRSGRYFVKRRRSLKKGWRSLSREDKSELAGFLQIIIVTVIIISVIYFLGVSGLTHISDFWSIFTGERTSTKGDTVAPPPPTFAPAPPYTNEQKAEIRGYAEPGSEVVLFVNNGETGKVITEAGGTFSFTDVSLSEGKNTLTTTATDKAGNRSQKSAELIITLDTEPPNLEVSKPQNNQTFKGEDKTIQISGKTDPGAIVRINAIQATVLADGTFQATIHASKPGQIQITVVATDKAGNEEKAELAVTYEN